MTTNTTERDALLHEARALLDKAQSQLGVLCGTPTPGSPTETYFKIGSFLGRLDSYINRTANASEASALSCALEHFTALRDSSDTLPVAKQVYDGVVLYLSAATPPSDREAVEGVTDLLDFAKRVAFFAWQHASWDWALVEGAMIEASEDWRCLNQPPSIAERARASDTNAAAAPVGQAVDDIIAERDHCEEVIDEILDCVLGTDRPEWSSSYGYADAIRDVENMTTPRAAYRQPTMEEVTGCIADIFTESETLPIDVIAQHVLRWLNEHHAVIAEEVPK